MNAGWLHRCLGVLAAKMPSTLMYLNRSSNFAGNPTHTPLPVMKQPLVRMGASNSKV